ncbi:MAG TPA: hypothetical protein VML75_03530 [Kofleriaceae bacterium]|nr:hypothetical protein [Kofleriaceae bacterium]
MGIRGAIIALVLLVSASTASADSESSLGLAGGLMFPGLWGAQADYRRTRIDGAGLYLVVTGSAAKGSDRSESPAFDRAFGGRVRVGWGRFRETELDAVWVVGGGKGRAVCESDGMGGCVPGSRRYLGPTRARAVASRKVAGVQGKAIYFTTEARSGGFPFLAAGAGAHYAISVGEYFAGALQLSADVEITYGVGDAGGMRAMYAGDMRTRGGGLFMRNEVSVAVWDPAGINVGRWPTTVFTALLGFNVPL